MHRWLIGLVAGLACAAGLSAYAVTAGGFPSFPWFQAVGVGEAPPATPGQVAVSGTATIGGNLVSSGAAGTPALVDSVVIRGGSQAQLMQINASASTDEKVYDSYVNSSGDLNFRLLNDAESNSNNWMTVTRSGFSPATVDIAGVVEFDGAPVSYAHFDATSSGCPLDAGYENSNMASCARNSAGSYTVTFSTPYPVKPSCVATFDLPGAGSVWDIISVSAAATGSVEVEETNSSGVTSDYGEFSLHCQ